MAKMVEEKLPRPIIGWREWISLPELGLNRIKAKVDTGARTSALHTVEIEPFELEGKKMVRFRTDPPVGKRKGKICAARVVSQRIVRYSSGQVELRYVIKTRVKLRRKIWKIELTLTRRDLMDCPMLLGRQAIRGRFCVDPGHVFRTSPKRSRPKRKAE